MPYGLEDLTSGATEIFVAQPDRVARNPHQEYEAPALLDRSQRFWERSTVLASQPSSEQSRGTCFIKLKDGKATPQRLTLRHGIHHSPNGGLPWRQESAPQDSGPQDSGRRSPGVFSGDPCS
jgi:hypothetical protein